MPATVRILTVEDNPDDAALVEREVRRTDMTCTFRRVDTREGMVAAVREFTPDVILTDHSLPTFSARDALQVGQQLSPGTPVIVVTGRLGDEPAVQYLQAGAADYIVKDHLHRLGPAVLRALDTKRSLATQARAHQLQTATYRIAQAAITAPGLEGLLPALDRLARRAAEDRRPHHRSTRRPDLRTRRPVRGARTGDLAVRLGAGRDGDRA